MHNFNDYMIFNSHYNIDSSLEELKSLSKELMQSFEKNKIVNKQYIKSKDQESIFKSFNPVLSKPIIDEINKLLAKRYD